jgi:phosphomannomutase
MNPAIFTKDDIVGVYPDQINEEDAWKIGCGTARFLRSLLRGYERGLANMQSLCVGRDTRTHSEPMARALIDGMNSTGTNVIDIGVIDTPQLYFAIHHLGTCGGVQVTASQQPAMYSGFKIAGLGAKPISADTGLQDVEHIAMSLLHTKGNSTGSVTSRNLIKE